MPKRHVFTYGSLMFEAVWGRVVAGRYRSCEAWLPDYRRFAIRGETYPAIVQAPGFRVAGRLWLDIDPADVDRLDRFEGAEYRRESVRVCTDSAVDATAALAADCYIWLDPARLLAHDWDAGQFEREHVRGFADQYGAGDPPPISA